MSPCGEAEALRGRQEGERIVVTCLTCRPEFGHGEARCRRCGRAGSVVAPQRMTRHPRGTLRAVVCHRDVPLCVVCDADVLEDVSSGQRSVPTAVRPLPAAPGREGAGRSGGPH